MSLSDLINAYDQRPTARVLINGAVFYQWEHIAIDRSYDQSVATATVTASVRLNTQPGMVYRIEIWQGYAGTEARTFSGYIDDVNISRFPNMWDLVCSDELKKARETWLDDTGATYSMVQAEDVVKDLLARAGIGNVQAGVSNFTIGDAHPSELKLVSVLDACNQVAGLIGWALWATPDGTVVFDYKKPLPGANRYWTYREASSPSATDGNIIGSYKYTLTDRHLRNRAVVIGYAKIRSDYSEGSPYVPTPPGTRTMILSSEMIDTNGMASAISQWMVKDTNHLWESAALRVPGNPLIRIGHTIGLIESNSGQNANYFVFAIHSEQGKGTGYILDLTVCGGNSSPIAPGDDDSENLTPEASFTYKQVAWGDPTYVVYFDGSGSSCPDSEITSWAWDFGDGESGSGVMVTHKYLAPGVVNVTLTVTAANGVTASCTKAIDVGSESDAGYIQRILYAGGESYVYISLDSGETWKSLAVPDTVTCGDAFQGDSEGTVIFGCADGSLEQIIDGESLLGVTVFPAGVTSVFVDQTDDTHWLVGLADGTLWVTPDSGAEWIQNPTTFPGAIARISFIDPTDLNHWMVAGNTFCSESFDAGDTWNNVLLNFSNGTMTGVNCMAWHFGSHLGVATEGGTVPVGYSPDNGATWQPSTGLSGVPVAITGGIIAPEEFAVAMQGDVVYTTFYGDDFTAGGSFYSIASANDLRYDAYCPGTLFAGG